MTRHSFAEMLTEVLVPLASVHSRSTNKAIVPRLAVYERRIRFEMIKIQLVDRIILRLGEIYWSLQDQGKAWVM